MNLYLTEHSQAQIAAQLGISQPAVSRIVARAEQDLLGDVAYRIERQRARHTLRLELIYAESMRAWRASQQDGLKKRQRQTDCGAGAAGTMAEVTSEQRHGDPRYLDEARKTLADLRTLWGVNAPDRIALEARPYLEMDDAALMDRFRREASLLASAGAVATDAPVDILPACPGKDPDDPR
jgi:DNA-binding MarR family transcriptional regulator